MAGFCLKSLHSRTLPQLFRLVFACNERPSIGVPTGPNGHSFGLYVAISTITRLVVSGNEIVNVDESSYMVGAWELLNGHLPYAGFADNKPPLIYVYYALTQLLGHGMWSVRVVTMLVTVPLTAWLPPRSTVTIAEASLPPSRIWSSAPRTTPARCWR